MKDFYSLKFFDWGFIIDGRDYSAYKKYSQYESNGSIIRAIDLLKEVISRYEVFYVRRSKWEPSSFSINYHHSFEHLVIEIGDTIYSVDFEEQEKSSKKDIKYVLKLIDKFSKSILESSKPEK